jgi:hypothetical protein
MYAPTDNVSHSQPVLMRLLVRPWVYSHHPRVWAGVLFASASWNLFLGVLMLAYGLWLGALPLAASALMFWIGYRLRRSVQS